jgi:hypothetical protein
VAVTVIVIAVYCFTGTLFALALVSAAHGAKRPVPARLDASVPATASAGQPQLETETAPKLTAESSQ